MTPAEFHNAYRDCADQVAAGTNIDPIALLSQWANETAWGTYWQGAPTNLANIRNGPGGAIQPYASLDVFAQDCIATFHNGYYQPVLDATNAIDQLAAIVASPWSAGHYGGTLMPYYTQLEGFELTPQQEQQFLHMYDQVGRIAYALGLTGSGLNPGDPVNPPNQTQSQELLDILAAVKAIPGGGTEPPEPAEPKTITLNIPSVPGTATGTLT